jgi:pyridoxamine 5'-phosphate oxidase
VGAAGPLPASPLPAGAARDVWHLGRMRREYAEVGLTEDDLAPTWLEQLDDWLATATEVGLVEPNAMVLATSDRSGRPSARTVLLKGLDENGLVFFTNYHSRKGRDLAVNPYASAVFPWHPIGRQVVVIGEVAPVPRAQTEQYFADRPREAQLSAWASPQSRPLGSRAELDALYSAVRQRFADSEPVPAPHHWGGLRIAPDTVEFWQGRRGRLHDRLRYQRTGDGWVVERIAP